MNVWARSPDDECLDIKPACRVLLQRVLRSPDGYLGLVMEKATGFDELSQS